MSSTAAPKRYELTPEDRYRVSRLSEEIAGRLEELARLTARVTGTPVTPDAVRKFAPIEPQASATFSKDDLSAQPTYIEIVCAPEGSECSCIVLMSDGNHFIERPCGSGHPL